MNKECKIVSDLLPSYVEDLVNEETRKYIEMHVENCAECKRNLENMKENKTKENQQNINDEKVEIRQIKRYKRKMTMIKVGISTLIVIIISMIGWFSIIYMPRYSMILSADEKIQEISQMDNYKFTINQYYIDSNTQEKYEYKDTFFYKDGKYKEEISSKNLENINIYFGDINSETVTYIYQDSNTMNKTTIHKDEDKLAIFDVFSDIKYHSENILSLIGVRIRDDNYNEKECYVLRYGNNNTNYREIWIDKETMLQVREIQKIDNNINFERTFLIEQNVVKNEDVCICK